MKKERTNQQNSNFIGNFAFVLIIVYGHTNASLLIAAGTNLRTVSARLGHSQTSTTANIYAHAIRSADAAAADTLNDLLSPKAPKKKAVNTK